jgi:hypothetical protein
MNPYAPAKAPSDGLGESVTRLFVATIVPIAGLFFLRLILASLPMIKNAGPIGELGVTPLVLIKASLDTVIYFLIIRFCMASSAQLKHIRPHLAEVSNAITMAGCALVATLAYSGYENLMASLAPMQMEVYNWVFLAVVLTPIALLVVIVTRRLDFFSNLIFGKLSQASTGFPAPYPAAAPAGPQAGWNPQFPPAAMPPGVAPVDPAEQQLRERLAGMQQRVVAARETAEKLRSQGRLSAEMSEAASKMQGYFDGAKQSLDHRDIQSAKGFADWAEYEANRLLAAAKA